MLRKSSLIKNPAYRRRDPSGDGVVSQTQKLKQKKVGYVIYPRKAEILVISTM